MLLTLKENVLLTERNKMPLATRPEAAQDDKK